MSEPAIEWFDTSEPDLSPREQQLMAQAREEGYAAGERHGYRIGGADAMRAATQLTTLLSDRRMREALETLRYFMDETEFQDRQLKRELEASSAYWRGEATS